MIITKIEVQKRNKNRVNLYLDDEFASGLSLETVMKNHLKEGQEIKKENLEYLINQTEKETALSKAVSYISKCQKTKREVFKYLLSKGFEEEIANFVIEKLEEYKFVDDELYVKNYIKFKNKNNGKRKLAVELKQKGIDENLSKEKLDLLTSDRDNVLAVLEKYLKNKELDLKTKQKAYRFLASRGYESEDINFALNCKFKSEE